MDFQVVQDTINKIEGVINSKVVSENNEIVEIHIIANSSRSPKQIVRDIESTLMAKYDFRIDKNKISIAVIQSEDMMSTKRIKLHSVAVKTLLNTIEYNVNLLYDNNEYTIDGVGINTQANRKKLIAQATLQGVEKIIGQEFLFDVQDVIVNTTNTVSVVTVIVNSLVGGHEEALVGSAVVRKDLNEAIARATLDAINRRIDKITA
ncbi:hypothetical protein ABG79_00591 [Caloramator mitchellensis]|uniref:Uncharacterized protein n=1 Tax=Caloramator mitchellensis TaxID=908809 RepID=A0A0R3JXJ7_CALMK|nr:hypothetical protein [Caloramator mitchellensis]KRQ87786.1 hypothetical protein ABG79_00591 [Caloramator mitchellensis]